MTGMWIVVDTVYKKRNKTEEYEYPGREESGKVVAGMHVSSLLSLPMPTVYLV